MMKKKLLSLLLCLTLVGSCFAFVGCGKKGETLKVFTMFGGEDALKSKFAIGVKEFKDAHPNVEVEDESIQATGEGFDTVVMSKFVVEKNAPDVMYVFAPGRNLAVQNKLATVASIREKYPDYGEGFPEVSGDPHTLAFLGNTFGFYYKKAAFLETDFASYSALKTKLSALGNTKVVNPAGEPHYWFNYIGLQKMGKKWADVSVPTKEWFNTNRTELIGVLNELKTYLVDGIGIDQSDTISYGNEKAEIWNSRKDFMVDGNWSSGGWYLPENTGAKPNDYTFRTMTIDDNPATTDIDESKYVMSGFFHGWMISKNCFKNEDKLKLAVDFVNKQCDNVLEYGGLAANGASASNDTALAKATKDILKINGAISCSPLDDKWLYVPAKNTFYSGLTDFLRSSTITAASVIDATIDAFA